MVKPSLKIVSGIVAWTQYVDTSKNGNPRQCLSLVDTTDGPDKLFTAVDSVLGYVLGNNRDGDRVMVAYRYLRGKPVIEHIENPSAIARMKVIREREAA
jgi:hypothetical protein